MKKKDEKVRLDLLLVKLGLSESREQAKRMIMAGIVEVNGERSDKPGHQIRSSASINVKSPYPPYVSRGGLKLEAALDHFSIDVKGKTILDAGASTGGFTDCLLQKGAAKVFAIDVGYGQFHWKLRKDPRVILKEKTNIRHIVPDDIRAEIHGAVIDVSFISLKLVIPAISNVLQDHSFICALIKPQFEAEKGRVGKGGVVRDESLREEIIAGIYRFVEGLDWKVEGHILSPILGPKGNKEFLIYLTR